MHLQCFTYLPVSAKLLNLRKSRFYVFFNLLNQTWSWVHRVFTPQFLCATALLKIIMISKKRRIFTLILIFMNLSLTFSCDCESLLERVKALELKFSIQGTLPRKNMTIPSYSIRMYWTNFWQPTIYVQQNIFDKSLLKLCSIHLYASFGTFCVQIGQSFEA